jgi:hypothetical protein
LRDVHVRKPALYIDELPFGMRGAARHRQTVGTIGSYFFAANVACGPIAALAATLSRSARASLQLKQTAPRFDKIDAPIRRHAGHNPLLKHDINYIRL